MPQVENRYVSTEKLAYWYFRLNGFLTMENFIVHPDINERPGQKTDADIYGVRFPFRAELDMLDDEVFASSDKTNFVFVEVTQGHCKLNGPWTAPPKRNIQYVLSCIGAFPCVSLDSIAESLYDHGRFEIPSERYVIELISVGMETSDKLREAYPKVRQLLLSDMLRFIHRRFSKYWRQKADHGQWDETGKRLWNYAYELPEDDFVRTVLGRLK